MEPDMRELLAEYAHDAWAGWMRFLFEASFNDVNGTVVIPACLVSRWKRQCSTSYLELPEEEKQSDRDEADRIIGIVESARGE